MKITSLLLIGAFTLANGTLWAGTGHQDSIDRLHMSLDVLHSIMDAPDKGIPEEVLPFCAWGRDAACRRQGKHGRPANRDDPVPLALR